MSTTDVADSSEDASSSTTGPGSRSWKLTTAPWDLVATSALFLVGVVLRFASTVDDPLITLRHAANLVEGNGPVFNVGERVEGATSALHLVVATGVHLLPGGDDLLKLKLASVVFGLLFIYACVRVVRLMNWPSWATATALVLIGGNWAIQGMSSNALETSLEAWLLVWLVELLLREDTRDRWGYVGTVGALLVLTRPEAVGLALALGVACIVLRYRDEGLRSVRWLAIPLGALALVTMARLAYFGSPVPNTFFAKRTPLGHEAARGIRHLLKISIGSIPFAPAAAAASVAMFGIAAVSAVRGLLRRDRTLYFAAPLAAQCIFVVTSGGDWMPFARFVVPVYPFIVLLFTATLVWLVPRLLKERLRAAVPILALLVIVPSMLTNPSPAWTISNGTGDVALIRAAGGALPRMWLKQLDLLACAQPGETIATSELGLAGYARMDLHIVDTRGLTDATIARDAPGSAHGITGVTMEDWYDPATVVGARILEEEPVMILSIEPPPPDDVDVLDGSYRPAVRTTFPQSGGVPAIEQVAWVREGTDCDRLLP